MTEIDLYKLLDSRVVSNLIEVYKAPLEETVERIFKENLNLPEFRFVHTSDRRVLDRYITCSYLGETLHAVIVDLENEHPIAVAFNPTPEGGYEISLEYKKEVTVVVE